VHLFRDWTLDWDSLDDSKPSACCVSQDWLEKMVGDLIKSDSVFLRVRRGLRIEEKHSLMLTLKTQRACMLMKEQGFI
jgi:hypothetical protein